MNVRAKFMLTVHQKIGYSTHHISHRFTFTPQYDPSIPEDQRFAKASPTGEMNITVDNPDVATFWESQIGKQFYLDFTPADDNAV